MKADLDELDRQAISEHRRERDRSREPQLTKLQLRLHRRWAFQVGVQDSVNRAIAGEGDS